MTVQQMKDEYREAVETWHKNQELLKTNRTVVMNLRQARAELESAIGPEALAELEADIQRAITKS